jgi:hypothetical protein
MAEAKSEAECQNQNVAIRFLQPSMHMFLRVDPCLIRVQGTYECGYRVGNRAPSHSMICPRKRSTIVTILSGCPGASAQARRRPAPGDVTCPAEESHILMLSAVSIPKGVQTLGGRAPVCGGGVGVRVSAFLLPKLALHI